MKLRSAILVSACLGLLVAPALPGQENATKLTREDLQGAQRVFGLEFSDQKLDQMLSTLTGRVKIYERMRQVALSNSVPPAIGFNPLPAGFKFETARHKPVFESPRRMKLPANRDELAFYSVGELAALVKARQITSEELTRFYLARLKKYGPKLECVATLTEDLALQQARRADAEIAAGKYRGPLHGIPYGAKDLLSTKGIRTTWGSAPFKDQVFNEDATVIKRLEEAGAVLVAKLTMGELAWDDVWYGGRTRNPWNLAQGSSGSSAGSASATSAGLVGFAIGSETWGSIVSPATRCGVTGLRPTYGRVSRAGAMALSWSMDKLGPLCRTVEDCALVLNAIYGPDDIDQSVLNAPFNYQAKVKPSSLKIGYLKSAFDTARSGKEKDDATLEQMRALGAQLIPIELPDYPVSTLSLILTVEESAAFDEFVRQGKEDQLVRAGQANTFRNGQFISAVEYLQANRIRYLIIQDMAKIMEQVDVYLAPTSVGQNSLLTNLTGHPCVAVPNGFSKDGTPVSITFIGRLFGEAKLLAAAKAYQEATDFHRQHPDLEKTLAEATVAKPAAP
jgi:Asp-tRNA(Asn)/Glu-tRNA(Gln) amidotransferase A subunit family amidase